jgi:hypothetical protein
MPSSQRVSRIRALLHAWLVLDFFGDARRDGGGHTSSLTTTIFSQSFLAFVVAALLYPETAPVPFAAANLSLSTLLVAIAALGDAERPHRRLADGALLATAPVRPLTVVLARSGHASFHTGLVTIGMALPPAILLAFLRSEPWQLPAYVLLAVACSGLATGALAVLRGLVAAGLGPNRAALAMGTVRAALLGAGFVLFVLGLQRLGKDVDAMPLGRVGAELLPTYQAARWLADPASEPHRLLLLVGAALALLLLAVAMHRLAPAERARVPRLDLLRGLLRRLAGRGPRLAIAEFTATSMWRSPGFRARALPLFGLPAGMAFLCLGGDGRAPFALTCLLLQLPAIYLPFLVAFLTRADQPQTGWVFEHGPPVPLATSQDAVWRALVTHVLLPVHAVAAVLVVVVSAERLQVGAASVFAASLSVLAARAAVLALDRVPFTEDHEQERGLELGGLMAMAIGLGAAAVGFSWLAPAARWPVAALSLAAAIGGLVRRPGQPARTSPPATATSTEAPQAPEAPEAPEASQAMAKTQPAAQPLPRDTAASLRRELRAIVVLYAALALLPALVGAAFAP